MHASVGFPADVAALAVEFLMCPFVVRFHQLSPSSLKLLMGGVSPFIFMADQWGKAGSDAILMQANGSP